MPIQRKPDLNLVSRAIAAEVRSAINDSLSLAERAVKRHLSGPTGSATLAARSGLLRGAAAGREIRGGPPPAPIIGRLFPRPLLRYAKIHEFGGVIVPKHGQYLAIPTKRMMGARGVGDATRASARPIGPRAFPKGFFLRRGGRLFFARAVGRGRRGRIEVLFTLVRSVRIPARRVWATSAIEIAPAVRARFARALKVAVSAVR